MKKKILLISLMTVVLVCLFAISAFAATVVSKTESEEYGTVIQLDSDPGLDDAKNYVSTLKKINDAGTDKNALCILTDGTYYYVFPSSYILDEESYASYSKTKGLFDVNAAYLAEAIAEFNGALGTNYYKDYATVNTGGAKRLNELVRFEFPEDVTYAHASYCCMRECPKLVEVKINHAISFSSAEKMFYKNTKLATVTGFENVSGTQLAKTMFASCSSIRYIKLPTDTVTIPGSFFQGAIGVNVVNMNELTQLTTISSWAFDGTKSLTITLPDSVTTLQTSAFENAFSTGGSLTINPTSQLKTIGSKAFRASSKLTSFYIPSTVTSIGSGAFDQCGAKEYVNFENCQITKLETEVFLKASVEVIKLPKTLTEISTAFSTNSNLKLVYIPKSVETVADTFTSISSNVVFLYTGTNASIFDSCTTIKGATKIEPKLYDENAEYTGVNVVIGYSHCVAYEGGVHGTTVLDRIEINSYYEPIIIHYMCEDCAMAAPNAKIAPLFSCLGYSAPKDGRVGLVVSFTVDNNAIAEYEAVSGKSVSYGVFAVSQSKLGENNVFDTNGNLASGAIATEITEYDFASFDLKILGFTDAQKDYTLAMGAYVATTKEGTTEYAYLQANEPNGSDKYEFTTYNIALNKVQEAA